MKICTRCNTEKDISLFQIRKASNDGYTSSCKSCLKKYDDSRLRDPSRMKARRDYQKTEKGKLTHNKAAKKWVETNIVKRSTHIITGNAIRSGKLEKKPCERCGETKVNAHHNDYAHPLKVVWLCDLHHSEWHRLHGEGANAS